MYRDKKNFFFLFFFKQNKNIHHIDNVEYNDAIQTR